MKAKELAERLLKNPDFDIVFATISVDSPVWFGYKILKFKDIDITNIEYSDKTITLGGIEA